MSQIFILEGFLKYKKQEDYENAKKTLIDGGWPVRVVDAPAEGGKDDGDYILVNDTNREIRIPYSGYRNLGRLLSPTLSSMMGCKPLQHGSEGFVFFASFDGCTDGGIIVDGEIVEEVDLVDLATTEGKGPPEIKDDNYDDYFDWENETLEWYKQRVYDRYVRDEYLR